uniref:Proopiomelanocortin n=1 Tax=Varanus komodoensis TaxID=61221 RepID=A0A8D2IZZ1_VARKO
MTQPWSSSRGLNGLGNCMGPPCSEAGWRSAKGPCLAAGFGRPTPGSGSALLAARQAIRPPRGHPAKPQRKPGARTPARKALSPAPCRGVGQRGPGGACSRPVAGGARASSGAEPGAEAEAERQARPEGKRSYAMEHFRWGKPVGRKRRPVKVFPAEAEEESAEGAARELRRGLSWDAPPGDGEPPEEAPHDGAAYRMRHFRWNAPAAPKKKRYGGFLAAERGHAPLLTLLRSAVAPGASPRGQ